MQKSIEIYPLTQGHEFNSRDNDFLQRFFIDFYNPRPNQATFKRKYGMAPRDDWFLLFDEAEKEILTDQYAFYGICYVTSVKLAVKRLESRINKLVDLSSQKQSKSRKSHIYFQGSLRRRDFLLDTKEALCLFNPEDEITLHFIVAEWPSEEEMEKTEYIKNFEDKIYRRGKFANDDIPF